MDFILFITKKLNTFRRIPLCDSFDACCLALRVRWLSQCSLSLISLFSYYRFRLFLNRCEPTPYVMPKNGDIHSAKIPVFVYWHQGWDDVPEVVALCRSVLIRNLAADNFEIYFLDSSSLKKFIDIPHHMLDKLSSGQLSLTHFSDYVRTALVAIYGGLWLDSTMLLVREMPQSIFAKDFFYFEFESDPFQFGSNQFIYAGADSDKKLLMMKSYLEWYWFFNNKAFSYFFYHFVMKWIEREVGSPNVGLRKYYSSTNHNLQNLMRVQTIGEQDFLDCLQRSFIHKLSYKYERGSKYDENFKRLKDLLMSSPD